MKSIGLIFCFSYRRISCKPKEKLSVDFQLIDGFHCFIYLQIKKEGNSKIYWKTTSQKFRAHNRKLKRTPLRFLYHFGLFTSKRISVEIKFQKCQFVPIVWRILKWSRVLHKIHENQRVKFWCKLHYVVPYYHKQQSHFGWPWKARRTASEPSECHPTMMGKKIKCYKADNSLKRCQGNLH